MTTVLEPKDPNCRRCAERALAQSLGLYAEIYELTRDCQGRPIPTRLFSVGRAKRLIERARHDELRKYADPSKKPMEMPRDVMAKLVERNDYELLHCDHVNDEPGIVAQIAPGFNVLIDGIHRLVRAYNKGEPFYVYGLLPAEVAEIEVTWDDVRRVVEEGMKEEL